MDLTAKGVWGTHGRKHGKFPPLDLSPVSIFIRCSARKAPSAISSSLNVKMPSCPDKMAAGGSHCF